MQRGTGGGVPLDEEELELLDEEDDELELLDEEDEEDELEEDDELELLDEEEDELDELELPDEDEDELELLGSELDDEEPGKPDEDELEEEESMAIRSGREREKSPPMRKCQFISKATHTSESVNEFRPKDAQFTISSQNRRGYGELVRVPACHSSPRSCSSGITHC